MSLGQYVAKKWWTPSTVAVVTGSNKGLGYEIVRHLAREGLTTVVTARNPKLGHNAVAKLKADLPDATIDFCELDVTKPASIAACAETLKEKYGKVDILVNNAGIAYLSSFSAEEAEKTMDCNVKGTIRMSEAVLPLMPQGGRMVNMCSRLGMLDQITSRKLRDAFHNPKSAEHIEELSDAFVEGCKNGTYREQGFSKSTYGMSKVAQMSYTKWLAGQVKSKGIGVYGTCPGYVSTDLTKGGGFKSVTEGVDTPVWLCLQPIGSIPEGALFAERSVVPW